MPECLVPFSTKSLEFLRTPQRNIDLLIFFKILSSKNNFSILAIIRKKVKTNAFLDVYNIEVSRDIVYDKFYI